MPTCKKHREGTVPSRKKHCDGTVPSCKKHHDGTEEKPTDDLCMTHIIQNTSYGELIMIICSTARRKKNTYSAMCITMSTFCAKSTQSEKCPIRAKSTFNAKCTHDLL